MQGKVKEDWMELCEQAAVEQDNDRLLELVRAINTMLEKKEERLARERAARGGF
jgi:predicted house-cleaning noncanonical NTP pyrophosphatase (MazG superfamily)